MTRQARTDLRDRMQRVAAKPATHPDTPKRARATSTRRSSAPKRSSAPRRRAPVPVELDPDIEADVEVQDDDLDADVAADLMPTSRSRLETLVAWTEWELMSVPRRRFQYLKQLLGGDGTSAHDDD